MAYCFGKCFDLHQQVHKSATYQFICLRGKPVLKTETKSLEYHTSLAPDAFGHHTIHVACSNCNLRKLCMPLGLSNTELDRFEEIVQTRRKIKKGDALFLYGDKFSNLYAIHTGFFKTTGTSQDGREQVTGFQMTGEIVGLDGIVNDQHTCNAIALEDAEVCVLPFERIEELSREISALQRQVHKIMSREIVRENGVMLLLGSMRAEERLAAFLLNLVQRLHARGFSPLELVLRMTREEIGNYLGLKLETVSRTFSKFMDDGILEVKQRNVRILKPDALKEIVNPKVCDEVKQHRVASAIRTPRPSA